MELRPARRMAPEVQARMIRNLILKDISVENKKPQKRQQSKTVAERKAIRIERIAREKADKLLAKQQKKQARQDERKRHAQFMQQQRDHRKRTEELKKKKRAPLVVKLKVRPISADAQRIQLDAKTVIYVRPGRDPQAVIDRFLNRP